MHYATGIVFTAVLLGVEGVAREDPTLLSALAVGAITVVIPLLLIRPAMEAGIAEIRTPAPIENCLKSLANHSVFGPGLT